MIKSLTVLLFFASCQAEIEFHVNITSPNGKECAGTIVSKDWIISSRNCTSALVRPLTLHFSEKLGSFWISLTADNIQVHPSDDLSMLKLPFQISLTPVHLNRGNIHLQSGLNSGTVGFVAGHYNERSSTSLDNSSSIAVPFVYRGNLGDRMFKACYWKLVNGLEPDNLGSGFIKQGFLIGVLNNIDKDNCGIFTSIEESTPWIDEIIAKSE